MTADELRRERAMQVLFGRWDRVSEIDALIQTTEAPAGESTAAPRATRKKKAAPRRTAGS